MNTIPVIYWSGTGNTKLMAEAVVEGIGAIAKINTVDEVSISDVKACEAIALGCSAMGVEVLEEYEFEPFFTELEPFLKGKKVALFGSYGWGGSYMKDWENRVIAAGGELVAPGVLAFATPDEASLESCRTLGKKLTNN